MLCFSRIWSGNILRDIRALISVFPTSASPKFWMDVKNSDSVCLFFLSEGTASGMYPSYSVPRIWKLSIWILMLMPYLNYEYFNPHAGPGGFAGSAIHIWSASGQHRPDCSYPGFPCRRIKPFLHIRLGYCWKRYCRPF